MDASPGVDHVVHLALLDGGRRQGVDCLRYQASFRDAEMKMAISTC